MREPDWQALADLQFLLYNRIADSLNAALSGIALSDMPEADDKPPGYWKERATNKIANVLNLFTAWSYLVRFKMGEAVPERAIRPFEVNTLLAWLGRQLQLSPPPAVSPNILLHANQETLQEALLLLYSAAYTQGTGVRLQVEVVEQGAWFRVRFDLVRAIPATLDDLLASFGDHWRAQDTRFELRTARDFVRLNGSEVTLNVTAKYGEFALLVHKVGVSAKPVPPTETAIAHIPETVLDPEAAAPPEPSAVPPDEAPAPTLGMLRPPPAAEGDAPPVEPVERTPAVHVSSGVDTPILPDSTPTTSPPPFVPLTPGFDLKPSATPLKAAPSSKAAPPTPESAPAQSTEDTSARGGTSTTSSTGDSVIVPVKIPGPKPPAITRKPPAATSNPALRPVAPDAAESSAEDPDAAAQSSASSDAQPAADSQES